MATTTTLKLPPALKQRIAPLAAATGKTPHAWMVEALESHALAAERRREFHREAASRLAEFDRAPVAFRAADVHRYLRARAAGNKASRPKPIKS